MHNALQIAAALLLIAALVTAPLWAQLLVGSSLVGLVGLALERRSA